MTGTPIFDQAEAPRQLGSSITPRVAKVHVSDGVRGVHCDWLKVVDPVKRSAG